MSGQVSNQLCACGCGGHTYIAEKTDSRRGQIKGKPMRLLAGHDYGTGGQSNVALAAPTLFEIDDLAIRRLYGVPDDEAAVVLDRGLRELERGYRRSFVARGLILREVEERKLWEKLTDAETGKAYTSFDRWIVSAAPHSRSDCFAALKAVKELRDVPTDLLLDMPRCNVSVLQTLSSEVRKSPKVIEAAQTLSKKDFIKEVQVEHPQQHIEGQTQRKWHFDDSALPVIDKGIEMGMFMEELETPEKFIEYLITDYIEQHEVAYDRITGAE